MRASLRRAATRFSTCSCNPWMVRTRSMAEGSAWVWMRVLLSSSVESAMEVSGVLSWCEMFASESDSESFSRSSSSTVRLSRVMTLSISLDSTLSSPSLMSWKSRSRSPERAASRRSLSDAMAWWRLRVLARKMATWHSEAAAKRASAFTTAPVPRGSRSHVAAIPARIAVIRDALRARRTQRLRVSMAMPSPCSPDRARS